MSKILIADDHPMVRAGLRRILLEDRSVTEIDEAASGNETLDRLRAQSWDLLILDINMPDRSGLDILRQVRSTHSQTRVLIASIRPALAARITGPPRRPQRKHALFIEAGGIGDDRRHAKTSGVTAGDRVLGGHRPKVARCALWRDTAVEYSHSTRIASQYEPSE